MRIRTIAIIGAGPAGATAAEKLARGRKQGALQQQPAGIASVLGSSICNPVLHSAQTSPRPGGASDPEIDANTRVLVFEENPGWEKPCGGGLPYKALRRYPFLLDALAPHTCMREAELFAGDGNSAALRLHHPLAIYSRAELNRLVVRRAEEAGAELVKDRILDFRRLNGEWKIQGRQNIYTADYLMLAAGARTRLRGRLAPHFAARDFMLTFGYYVPGTNKVLRVQFFEEFEGYAWSFPRTDHFSVGICGKVGESTMPRLRERLHGFMKRLGYRTVSGRAGGGIFSHLLPALSAESWHNLKLRGEGWALAGDAAGLVDPVTGEGIYFAMRSGDLIAESLLAGAPDTYPERVWQEFGRKLALGARLAQLFYHDEFLGQPSTTRLVQFAARSQAFTNLLESLIEGKQSYAGLASQLYKTLGRALIEVTLGGMGIQPSQARDA